MEWNIIPVSYVARVACFRVLTRRYTRHEQKKWRVFVRNRCVLLQYELLPVFTVYEYGYVHTFSYILVLLISVVLQQFPDAPSIPQNPCTSYSEYTGNVRENSISYCEYSYCEYSQFGQYTDSKKSTGSSGSIRNTEPQSTASVTSSIAHRAVFNPETVS